MAKASYQFRKMNGLGNDFAVFDARALALPIGAAEARLIACREAGVGCDQVIVIEPSSRADAFMRIWNADGSLSAACGNATRCVAAIIAGETGAAQIAIETSAGVLICTLGGDGRVTVDMGPPRFGWRDIPLAREMDTLALAFSAGGGLDAPGAVNVGNPHCVFWVEDVEAHDLAAVGPRIEHNVIFPERVNVSLAQIVSPDRIVLRVWERGAGLTKACGTAACAAAVASARLGLTGRNIAVALPGGDLAIEWRERDGHILMTGPYELEFEGEITLMGQDGGAMRKYA